VEDIIKRFIKALVVSAIAFIGMRMLGASFGTSILVGVVALLAGSLQIMPGMVYSVALLLFICGVGWTTMPADLKSNITKTVSIASAELADGSIAQRPAAPPPASVPPSSKEAAPKPSPPRT
jgi:hypothetical protein